LNELSIIQNICVWTLPVLLAIVLHEVAHGWAAYQLGDPTAKFSGRLTLNPLPHIDILGTVVLPILFLILPTPFLFGWAKPVPVNFKALRYPKRDMALVALAGPVSNLLMALGWGAILKLGVIISQQSLDWAKPVIYLIYLGQAGIFINLILGLINLLPIPPLDGSKILYSVLPPKALMAYQRLEPFGFMIIIALLALGLMGRMMAPLLMGAYQIILSLYQL
jgi:Zn-dependent protease